MANAGSCEPKEQKNHLLKKFICATLYCCCTLLNPSFGQSILYKMVNLSATTSILDDFKPVEGSITGLGLANFCVLGIILSNFRKISTDGLKKKSSSACVDATSIESSRKMLLALCLLESVMAAATYVRLWHQSRSDPFMAPPVGGKETL